MSESQLNSRDITFRTVFHDVEGIKSYLRKLRHENERVMKNIEGVVSGVINKVLNDSEELKDMISGLVNEAMDPLQTAWVNAGFADYIANNISDTTIDLISNNLFTIIDYNSGEFNSYINSAVTSDTVAALVSPLKTEWVSSYFISYIANNISDTTIDLISDNIINIISDNTVAFNAYISNNITSDTVAALVSPLKTEWVSSYFISYIANQFTETDIKNILNDYHSIKKYYTTLTDTITVNVDNGTLTTTAALKRFRILAYISGDNATDNLHYKYTSNAITEDAYTVTGGNLMPAVLTIADLTVGESSFNVTFNNEDPNAEYKNYLGGTLWYGFTDLVDPSLLKID